MGKPESCKPLPTTRVKTWTHDEYYVGERDKEHRRSGAGEHHWTGPESLEWYTGHFVRDAMNGHGEYRWRYYGKSGAFITYEGQFYANAMHGYGTMSYPDGRVFTGLFHKNVRWGPGVVSHTCLQEDVGLWRGTQLVRLAWRPSAPSVALDFITGYNGKAFVEQFRVMLAKVTTTIGATNSAIELLKQSGADPITAANNWSKLYLKHCSDLNSVACHVAAFDHDYYKGKVHSLEEVSSVPEDTGSNSQDSEDDGMAKTYFAWNNGEMMLHVMKHCYKHDSQRKSTRIELAMILNGPRNHFRPAGKHERNCRTLLMASYLGHINNVAQLINEHDVYPDVSDMQGNTALMYATCGDHCDIIHFLIEAGANINCPNDSCCTPLGTALMRYICAERDIPPNAMVQALLPQRNAATDSPKQLKVLDWQINREIPEEISSKLPISMSKTRTASAKKVKSFLTVGETTAERKKIDGAITNRRSMDPEYDSDDSFSEDKRLYYNINNEYSIRVNNIFLGPNVIQPYLFEVNDMIKELETSVDKHVVEKTPVKKVSKEKAIKPSKEVLWQSNPDEITSLDSSEKFRQEMLSKMMLTILQLLSDGADPRLVRCPQPALFMAVTAKCPNLVRHLVRYGVDVNETYPEALDYTALDIATSNPFTPSNVEIIGILLENGADANHRLKCPDTPGPTLLYAVLTKETKFEFEEEILHQIVELLLKYNCNPANQYKGQSAIDFAMMKSMSLLNIFIKNPKINLNGVINSANQSILVKMLSLPYFKHTSGMDRFPVLTDLLLYGADPLIECQNLEDKYRNIFAFAHIVLAEMENPKTTGKLDVKSQKSLKSEVKMTDTKGKNGKGKAVSPKSVGKSSAADDISDYKQSIDLMTECARMLHIRWLQAKLMKELIAVIFNYKHRPWNMILKEHKGAQNAGLWLTPQRCLEIWDILKATKRKLYKDDRILRHLLCIVHFYNKRSETYHAIPMTAVEKNMIEAAVGHFLKEHKLVTRLAEHTEVWKELYVKPELDSKTDAKYDICFECALPLDEDNKIACSLCGLISFCSFDCMKINVDRIFCHPCSDHLKEKYFSEFY